MNGITTGKVEKETSRQMADAPSQLSLVRWGCARGTGNFSRLRRIASNCTGPVTFSTASGSLCLP